MTMNSIKCDEHYFDEVYEDFYNETEVLLTETEVILLSIDIENPNMDELNSVALSVRLLMENAVMFNPIYLSKADITDILEISVNWLDKICKHQMAITDEHVNQFLKVNELLKIEVARHRIIKPMAQKNKAGSKVISNATHQAVT